MKCKECGADTKVVVTQYLKHIPEKVDPLVIIRRRRVCLQNPTHKIWTVEVTEEIWQKATNRKVDLYDV